MQDGKLELGPLERPSTHHGAIVQFFRSLGEVHRERAVAIVLSGAGSDGAEGLKRVKEGGGVALVQSPADAQYDSMPLNAIAAGVVDFVLPVIDMGQKLVELWANARRIELPEPPGGYGGLAVTDCASRTACRGSSPDEPSEPASGKYVPKARVRQRQPKDGSRCEAGLRAEP
jgi:two-component system CheB/CheR fusion protein